MIDEVQTILRRRLLKHPQHPLRVRGVGHHEVPLLLHPVDDQVLDHAAALVQHEVVERLSDRRLAQVVRDDPLQHREGPRSGDLDLAQVREIEEPHAFAHRLVFLQRTRVLDRHVPAREGSHLRSEARVFLLERRVLELLISVTSSMSGMVRPSGPGVPDARAGAG